MTASAAGSSPPLPHAIDRNGPISLEIEEVPVRAAVPCLDARLELDEMISSRIDLEDINDAFGRLGKGEAARRVIVFDA